MANLHHQSCTSGTRESVIYVENLKKQTTYYHQHLIDLLKDSVHQRSITKIDF